MWPPATPQIAVAVAALEASSTGRRRWGSWAGAPWTGAAAAVVASRAPGARLTAMASPVLAAAASWKRAQARGLAREEEAALAARACSGAARSAAQAFARAAVSPRCRRYSVAALAVVLVLAYWREAAARTAARAARASAARCTVRTEPRGPSPHGRPSRRRAARRSWRHGRHTRPCTPASPTMCGARLAPGAGSLRPDDGGPLTVDYVAGDRMDYDISSGELRVRGCGLRSAPAPVSHGASCRAGGRRRSRRRRASLPTTSPRACRHIVSPLSTRRRRCSAARGWSTPGPRHTWCATGELRARRAAACPSPTGRLLPRRARFAPRHVRHPMLVVAVQWHSQSVANVTVDAGLALRAPERYSTLAGSGLVGRRRR